MSRELRATYRTTTPMFLGDASQQAPTHIRPPSVRGALRWWWRASMWPEIRRQHDDDAAALRALHCREAEVWGAASKRVDDLETGGQGVILRVRHIDKVKRLSIDALSRPPNGRAYLLGQGIYDRKEGYRRSAIKMSSRFQVRLILQPNKHGDCATGLLDALWLWGMLGGLGSRSRRGLGSVSLEALEWPGLDSVEASRYVIPDTPNKLADRLKSMVGDDLPSSHPPFPAFSTSSRIDCSVKGANADSLLNLVGQKMLAFRGPEKDAKLKADTRMVMATTEGTRPTGLPRRAVFGLPHNYFFLTRPNKKVGIAPKADGRDRRASPLLVHVHRFPNGGHAVLHTFFPSRFLPQADSVGFEPAVKRGADFISLTPFEVPASPIDWDLVSEYLDQFDSKERLL